MLFPEILDSTFKFQKINIRGDIYDRNGKILATSVMKVHHYLKSKTK